jgi:hypothetical protein
MEIRDLLLSAIEAGERGALVDREFASELRDAAWIVYRHDPEMRAAVVARINKIGNPYRPEDRNAFSGYASA